MTKFCKTHTNIEAPGLCPICLMEERDRLRNALRDTVRALDWAVGRVKTTYEVTQQYSAEHCRALETLVQARALLAGDETPPRAR